jgi:hypothetical protein
MDIECPILQADWELLVDCLQTAAAALSNIIGAVAAS